MKNLLFSLLTILLLAACQSGPTPEQAASQEEQPAATPAANSLTDQERTEGWRLLFDGKSTEQWRGYNQATMPTLGWVAKDEALVIEKTPSPKPDGFGGDILTKDKFKNFELSLDYMTSDTANSGIFYFVMEVEGEPMYFSAPEYQILDDVTYKKMGEITEAQLSGANYDMEPCAGDFSKPNGEWNTAKIIHKDGHVEHWLNGQKCVEYDVRSEKWNEMYKKSKFKDWKNYAKATEGHIGLQDHNHEVRFKNIKIRNL